jgi:hypothetical protein
LTDFQCTQIQTLHSAILMHGHAGQLPRGPMLIYEWCVQHVFFNV